MLHFAALRLQRWVAAKVCVFNTLVCPNTGTHALSTSTAMRNFVTARKQAKTQAASSATHAAKLARWDKLVDSVIACVQHGIDTALPRILERAAAV